jgi:hypothetical protein
MRVERLERQPLEPMPQAQQVGPVLAQLAGQPRRRDALGDAAEHQEDLRGAIVRLVERRRGEGVEDGPAGRAAIVEDRGAMASVDLQAIGSPAPGAGQAVGVEDADELAIAGVLVHQIGDREVHGRLPRGSRRHAVAGMSLQDNAELLEPSITDRQT